MKAEIAPSVLSGSITAPSSKSSVQRAFAAALLHNGTTNIYNAGESADEIAALNILVSLGIEIIHTPEFLQLLSPGFPNDSLSKNISIEAGESGLALRMFTAILSLSDRNTLINGSGSLTERPVDFFSEVFPDLGIHIKTNLGKLPIEICGPLMPRNITVDGSISSQFLTGLLYAFSASATEPVTINVNHLKSKPYIDLTLDVLKQFGHNISHDDYDTFIIDKRFEPGKVISYHAESDWSNAAFLLVAGALSGDVTVKGLSLKALQGDKIILDVLESAGTRISIAENEISIQQSPLSAFEFDATDYPDLFPPLVALASGCTGISKISGVTRLFYKESNRAEALQKTFKALGRDIQIDGDDMFIAGGLMHHASVSSFNDHRIAMAAAVAGIKNGVGISDAECINKSYPAFFNDLRSAGLQITLSN